MAVRQTMNALKNSPIPGQTKDLHTVTRRDEDGTYRRLGRRQTRGGQHRRPGCAPLLRTPHPGARLARLRTSCAALTRRFGDGLVRALKPGCKEGCRDPWRTRLVQGRKTRGEGSRVRFLDRPFYMGAHILARGPRIRPARLRDRSVDCRPRCLSLTLDASWGR